MVRRTEPVIAPGARPPEGVLLVDKPAGPTSHDVVEQVRRALRPRRAGHAGTLDPFATGLLVVVLGRATRLVRYLAGGAKTYEGIIRLGLTTDTDDVTGRPLGEEALPADPEPGVLEAAARALTGRLLQEPPVFSARKVSGVPAHRRARRGQPVELKATEVTVHEFDLGEPAGARIPFRAVVSPGTYIRALARDLGRQLGTGACLESLRRVASEPWRVEDAVAPGLPAEVLSGHVLDLDRIPLALPSVRLDETAERRFVLGQAVEPAEGPEPGIPPPGMPGPPGPPGPDDARVRVLTLSGRFLGVGRVGGAGPGERLVHPEVVLDRPDPEPDTGLPRT